MCASHPRAWGLSPDARGSPLHWLFLCRFRGPIPACAGEPSDSTLARYQGGAYPRIRGGAAAQRLDVR